jgi:hypothetical protein
MYNGLRGVNCIYDDGTVVSMDAGPCEEVQATGAYLVDTNISESEITVTTPAPIDWWPIALGLGLVFLIGGRRVHR